VLSDRSVRHPPALPGQETLIASWTALTQTSPGARLIHSSAAVAAVFPEWAPLNNAILLTGHDQAATVAQLDLDYVNAGVDTWALWRPSQVADLDTSEDERPVAGLTRDATTLVMQATLRPGRPRDIHIRRTSIAAATRATDEPVPLEELGEPDPSAGSGLAAWAILADQVAVAGAWSMIHDLDCGIYTVGTCPGWRRRGLARSLVRHIMADAHRQGARTATLQSTPMAQRLYESLGFQATGRYEEWVSPGQLA
jgi:ribosomal protein S18 acetylase RimI-like enzyme